MTFLSLNIEKSSLTIQKSQLEFQEMILSEELNTVEQQMQDLTESADGDSDITSTSAYKTLELMDEQYNSQKEAIESQLKSINAEIEGYDKAVDTNIKSECKLSISV
jgi:hypothetical protein